MMRTVSIVTMLLASAFFLGCGKAEKKKQEGPDAGKYRLSVEPTDPMDVLEARGRANDGEEVVVVGRVGGAAKPMIAGRAAFTIVDLKFIPCDEREGDNCPTPWDYCCDDPKELAQGTLLVKFVDDTGKTIEHDAEAWLGVRPLETLVIQGALKKSGDSIELLAKGFFVRKKK